MNSIKQWDAAFVEKAVSQIVSVRSAYTSLLDFYGPVFVAQVRAAEATSPKVVRIDESRLELAAKEGFSLIEPAAFSIDLQSAEKLLVQICRAASSSGQKLGLASEALERAISNGEAMADLFADVLDDKGKIREVAEAMDLSPDMFSLLLYLAVKPSIEKGSRQLAKQLTDGHKNRSSCPVCGSAPIIGELDEEGHQWLHCGFCWCRWPVKRLACAFCDNRDSASLEYIYSDDEPEYRVNLCGNCRRYVKVVDTRKMDRHFYPPLEQVVSLHLDMLAEEKGCRHAIWQTDASRSP